MAPEPAETATETPDTAADEAVLEPSIINEVLVEEISIDGMCGVY